MKYAFYELNAVTDFNVSLQQIKERHPNISFPVEIRKTDLPLGVIGYDEVAQPSYDSNTHKVVEVEPTYDDGNWKQTWAIVPLSQEELDQLKNDKIQLAKTERAELVAAIKVTTSKGRTFDGDEKAQDRMTRVISVMEDGDQRMWVLADNTVIYDVTKAELKEALGLAMIEMGKVWAAPYQQ